jgi:hypothetical protein
MLIAMAMAMAIKEFSNKKNYFFIFKIHLRFN